MTDPINDSKDLAALIQHHSAILARLRRQADAIKSKKAQSGTKGSISDHAIVRYLERTGIVDIGAVRRQLRELCNEAIRLKGKKQKDRDHCWHPDGLILIVGPNGNIITVLGRDQVEKFEGRKLITGERVPIRTLAGTETTLESDL